MSRRLLSEPERVPGPCREQGCDHLGVVWQAYLDGFPYWQRGPLCREHRPADVPREDGQSVVYVAARPITFRRYTLDQIRATPELAA